MTKRKSTYRKRCWVCGSTIRTEDRKEKECEHCRNERERAKKLGKKAYLDPKPRECLRCGKTFPSRGPWNRVCDRCKSYEPSMGNIPRMQRQDGLVIRKPRRR